MSRFTTVMVVAASVAATPLSAQTDSMVARALAPSPWSPTVIEPDSLDRAAFSNLGELLQARVPGLSVTRRGDGGTVIHLRGPSTVLAENSPLLIVDGVRISLTRNRLEEFEGRPSPLDDIDVEQIERVEILSGPAVAAMYGTGAANGVIKIRTRDARVTPMQWRVFTAVGRLAETTDYPGNFARLGVTPGGQSISRCTRLLEATEACTPTGPVTSSNPLEDEGIIRPASLVRAGGSLSAGTDLLAWTAGTTFEHQGSVTDQVVTRRLHHRGAVRARISTGASLTLRGHWMEGVTPLYTSQWLASLREQALIGFGVPPSGEGFVRFPEPERDIARRGLSIHADWQVLGWLRGSVLAGMDYSSGTDRFKYTFPLETRTFTITEYVRQRRHDFTGRADVEGAYRLGALAARTAALLDVVEHRRRDRFEELTTSSGGAGGWSLIALERQQSVTGLAVQQEFAAGDRAALRLGIRREDLGGVPTGWKTQWYPQGSLAIVAARERSGLLNGLRLHVAYGKAGALPVVDGFFVQPPGAGSGQGEAEQTTERQAGFDATWLNRRADLALSWYSRRSTGVLLPTSFGRYVTREVRNRGVEVSLRARVLDIPRARWEIRAGFAHNHNEARGGAPYLLSQSQWISEGAPLGAYHRFPLISATDLDGDGVFESACTGSGGCEVVYGTEREYVSPAPPTELSLDNEFRFGPVGLTFLLDHRRGHFLHNLTEESRCWRGRCGDAYASSSSFEEAIRQASARLPYSGAFLEDATFTRLRELSIRVDAPRPWARGVGGSRLEVTLAGRNLATWTPYTGMDPEASSSDNNTLLVSDFASAPLPRSVSLRLTLER